MTRLVEPTRLCTENVVVVVGPMSVNVMFDTSWPAAGLRLLTVGRAKSAFQSVRTVVVVGLFAVVFVTSAIVSVVVIDDGVVTVRVPLDGIAEAMP